MNKKLIKALTIVTFCLTVTSTTMASTFTVNNKNVNAQSISKNGTTMVPIRLVSENLGAKVDFNAKTNQIKITKDSTTINFTIGNNTAVVNGNTMVMSQVAFTKNNITYVPIRFVAESLNCTVNYDSKTGNISIVENEDTGLTQSTTVGKTDAIGNKIRTTNLPTNAKYFPYIQEGIPNWAYEQQSWGNNAWSPARKTTRPANQNKALQLPNEFFSSQNENCGVVYDNIDKINAFLNSMLNVDYKTIDEKTLEKNITNFVAMNCFDYHNLSNKKYNNNTEYINASNKAYIKLTKKYRVKTHATFKVMPETSWVSTDAIVNNAVNFSVYYKFTIDNCKGDSLGFNDDTYIISSEAKATRGWKTGHTYEGILNLQLIKDENGDFKLNPTLFSFAAQINPRLDAFEGVCPSQRLENRAKKFSFRYTMNEHTRYETINKL